MSIAQQPMPRTGPRRRVMSRKARRVVMGGMEVFDGSVGMALLAKEQLVVFLFAQVAAHERGEEEEREDRGQDFHV